MLCVVRPASHYSSDAFGMQQWGWVSSGFIFVNVYMRGRVGPCNFRFHILRVLRLSITSTTWSNGWGGGVVVGGVRWCGGVRAAVVTGIGAVGGDTAGVSLSVFALIALLVLSALWLLYGRWDWC